MQNKKQAKQVYVFLLLISLLFMGVVSVTADTSYDESIDGDLSGDRLAPTVLSVTAGNNRVTASSVRGDLEYFVVTVPAGHQLKQVLLEAYDSTADQTAFIAVQSGTTFTVDAASPSASSLLGWLHFTSSMTNLLPSMGSSGGAIGFDNILPAGDYTFWTQQTNPTDVTTYRLNFEIEPLATAVTVSHTNATAVSTWLVTLMLSGLILISVALTRQAYPATVST